MAGRSVRARWSSVIVVAAFASAASAQTPVDPQVREQNWARCADDDPDISIPACTALIDSGVEEGEDLITAIANRAISYGQKREWNEAIVDYERAFALNTENADIRQILTRALLNRGAGLFGDAKYDEAMRDFERSTKVNPDESLGWAWVGAVHDIRGQYDLAIVSLDTSVKLNPRNTGAWFYRGVAYYGKAQYPRAIEDFDAALKVAPGFPLALFARGVTRQRTGDAAGAETDMTAAKTIQADIAADLAKLKIVPR